MYETRLQKRKDEMMDVRCLTCAGSGKVMGGGMMYRECENCEGAGKLYKLETADEHKYVDDMKEEKEKINARKNKKDSKEKKHERRD